jgi:hypothetical protein
MTTLYKYIKRGLKQSSNKKVRPREFQERDFMAKRYYFPTRLQGQVNACAMTFTTMDGDKHTRHMNVGAVKKYSVKNRKLDKSQT